MQIETLPLDQVTIDPANVRAHPTRNLDAIKASLQKFGQQKPIVIDRKGVCVAGNGTVEAARALGWTEVRVVRTELEGAEAVAYAIADNRTGDLAEWDEPELAAVLTALQEDDSIDVSVTGFDSDEIAALLEKVDPPQVHEDEVPAVQETCITRPGDLWLLGDHRLLCGDSTKESIEGPIVTDPPYGVDYADESWDDSDEAANDALYQWVERQQVPTAYFCGTRHLVRELQRGPFKMLIWYKSWSMTHSGIGNGRQHWEPIILRRLPKGAYIASDVIPQNTDREPGLRDGHSCPKPVELLATLIRGLFPDGDISDPFLGSGTTLIAAEQLGRRCYGIEIEPKYCDVICRRWSRLTGKEPVRESDGVAFSGVNE
jgi:hypothetical protein